MFASLISVLYLLEGESTVDFSTLISALTGAVTPAQIVGWMAAVVTGGMGIYVTFVYGRKVVRGFTRALRGKAPTM